MTPVDASGHLLDQIPREFLTHLNTPIEPLVKMRMASVTPVIDVDLLLDQVPMDFRSSAVERRPWRFRCVAGRPGRTGVPAALHALAAMQRSSAPVILRSFQLARGCRGSVLSAPVPRADARPSAAEAYESTVSPEEC